jgi:acetolactate synthase I/II/III large subunit
MSEDLAAKQVVEALIEKDVEVLFSLSGGHITPIYQFLEGSSIRIFDTRHEQAAVFMAEAWGRMTRRPGVALVTAGPGFTNALTAVANANMANSPLLVIAGVVGVEMNERLDLQDMRQAPVIEPIVKRAFVCHSPTRIKEFIDMAWRVASTGRPGPVYLEIPVDVLNAKVDPSKIAQAHTVFDTRPVDLAGAARLVDMLGEADQPMIVAGSGAWYADAGDELTALAERSGVPVFTMSMGRGVMSDEHPMCFESGMGIRPNPAMAALASADLVIVLGHRISLYSLFGDVFTDHVRLVQVDIEPTEIGRNHSVHLPIMSDVKPFLAEVNRLLEGQGEPEAFRARYDPWMDFLRMMDQSAKVSVQPDWDREDVPIHPMRLANEVNRFMDRDDDVVVADGGDTQIWMGMTRTVRRGGVYLDSGLFGCLGVGLPFANAAKLLDAGRRVCLIVGDGSVGFNFMEFEAAVRHGLPIVVVISNDLGWGMIRHSQEIRLGHAIEDGTFIGTVRYEKMVEALGGKGFFVERPEDIRPAIEAAFAAGVPACINVMTDPTTISPGSVTLASVGAYKG